MTQRINDASKLWHMVELQREKNVAYVSGSLWASMLGCSLAIECDRMERSVMTDRRTAGGSFLYRDGMTHLNEEGTLESERIEKTITDLWKKTLTKHTNGLVTSLKLDAMAKVDAASNPPVFPLLKSAHFPFNRGWIEKRSRGFESIHSMPTHSLQSTVTPTHSLQSTVTRVR